MEKEKCILVLSIFDAAYDCGDDKPENIPYFCELSLNCNNCAIVTKGYIYIKKPNENGFNGWDLSSFEIDNIGNSDSFHLSKTQDNNQGYEFSSDLLDDDRSQYMADLLDFYCENLENVITEYPNGFIELEGLDK